MARSVMFAFVVVGAFLPCSAAFTGCAPDPTARETPAAHTSATGRSTSSPVPHLPSARAATGSPAAAGDDDDGVADEPTPAAVQRAATVAEAFLRAWARPSLDARSWLAGVVPYAAPGYVPLLRSVDPANVPAHAVTGPPVVVRHDAATAVLDVPTDAGVIRVTCVAVGDGWLVATVEPWPPAGGHTG
jgi:hypothetical protein